MLRQFVLAFCKLFLATFEVFEFVDQCEEVGVTSFQVFIANVFVNILQTLLYDIAQYEIETVGVVPEFVQVHQYLIDCWHFDFGLLGRIEQCIGLKKHARLLYELIDETKRKNIVFSIFL